LLTGSGKGFTSGLDLSELGSMLSMEEEDVGRKAFTIQRLIADWQQCISSVEIVI
jgi:enoyl-CoA hydratase/carnithine racemase